MSGSHPTLQAKDPIARRPCPKCGKDMMISRIMPDRPGYELPPFECAGCGHDELVLT